LSLFWERCSICGRHRLVKECWLHPERNVCPYCCITCPERNDCPNPVWLPQLRIRVTRREARKEAEKALEELLAKLSG